MVEAESTALRTVSRHRSLLADFLAQSDTLPPSADLTWSVQRIGDLPRDLVPSTFPCTTNRSMESLSRLVTWPKYCSIRDCTTADRRCVMPSSWSMDTLVRNSVHDIPSIFRQHHISRASIFFFSNSRTVHVSAA